MSTEHKSISDIDFQLKEEDRNFKYQKDLTNCLDNHKDCFDQEIINKIVLWKTNRFAEVKNETLILINKISISATAIDKELTSEILRSLLNTKGIKLPMASTILRFRNPNVYQIIDQRVYRIIYPQKKLLLPQYLNEKNFQAQLDLYVTYLTDLKKICADLDIPFNEADRILYCADKRINKDVRLDNYGTPKTGNEYGE